MVLSTDPFAPIHWVLFAAALVAAYGVGGLLRFRTGDPLTDIGLRLCLGLTAITCWLATACTMGNTVLLPLSVFLLASIDIKNAGQLLADLRASGPMQLSGIALFALSAFAFEAWRSDLRMGDMLATGFPDIASYAAFGNGMMEAGSEGLPNNVGTVLQHRPVLYHMGDLWLSALFSQGLNVLPQYAYTLLARGTSLVSLGVLLFALGRRLSGSPVIALVVVALSLLGVDTVLYYLFHPTLSLLQTFVYNWPLYASGPYTNVALAALPFVAVSLAQRSLWPLVGLMLVTCLNPGVMLSFVAGSVALALIRAGLMLLWKRGADRFPFTFKELGILFAAAAVPFAFASISGRSQGGAPPIADPAYLYLIVHTAIRTILSTMYFIPVLVGLLFLINDPIKARAPWLILAGYAGTMAAFSAVFPWMQGNTVQMPALYCAALLAPAGVLGLAHMWHSKGWSRYLAAGMAAAMLFASGRLLLATDGYAGTYRDLHATGGVQGLSNEEHAAFCAMADRGLLRVGYHVDVNTEYPVTRPHYTEFTGIKGLMNRVEFYRLNELPSDTASALEMRQWYNNSAVAHYNALHPGRPDAALRDLMTDLDPQVLITMTGTDVYTMPAAYAAVYSQTDTVGRFIFHTRP
jgi:hypothetical protein